jgi:hypothetical protein
VRLTPIRGLFTELPSRGLLGNHVSGVRGSRKFGAPVLFMLEVFLCSVERITLEGREYPALGKRGKGGISVH